MRVGKDQPALTVGAGRFKLGEEIRQEGSKAMSKRVLMVGVLLGCLLVGSGRSAGTKAPGYLLNMYHFNIQYIAGSEKAMRRCVEQGLVPLVDFYLAHPQWHADFEMQGQYLEYLDQNYPEVLRNFKTLVEGGQAELVSFHYGDELILAYPRRDREWSFQLNEEIFQRYGFKRSGVIFTQEAQFGEGLADFGREHGYSVFVLNHDQYAWFQDDDRFPYYSVRGLDVIEKRDVTDPNGPIRVRWLFLGDGEVAATGGSDPYFSAIIRATGHAMKKLEKDLQAAEADGYKIATVSEYRQALSDTGFKPVALKPQLDSPWRPEDGSGVFQWMGYYGFAHWEEDYELRTGDWLVRDALLTAEEQGRDQASLKKAWGHLLNAEVSDPTGWYPLPVEIRFSKNHHAAALLALDLTEPPRLSAKEFLGYAWQPASEPPVMITISGRAKHSQVIWEKAQDRENLFVAEVTFKTPAVASGLISVSLPLSEPVVAYSPAGLETEVREIPFSEMKPFQIHLGLPNGLIGLGRGWWLVRENRMGVLAGGVDSRKQTVSFDIQNAKAVPVRLRFFIFPASPEEAAAFANKINRI